MADEATRWTFEGRRYFLDRFEDGVAQRVRAERHDDVKWVRTLEAVYWWPAREGKEWPCQVIVPPDDDTNVDLWAYFEDAVGMDERYRWEPILDE